jgi:hypothetical protein
MERIIDYKLLSEERILVDINKINDLVAEMVMGFIRTKFKGQEGWGTPDNYRWFSHFNPAGDISDAWLVAQKLFISVCPQQGAPKEMSFHAEIDKQPFGNYYEVFAETGPLAISLVALKNYGVKIDELL